MGAERCIVLLVVVVMGTGLFMVNSVVDEDAFRKYSEDVADYNQLHDETLLDNVMHVRHPPRNDFDTNEFGRDQVKVKRSSGQGINEDPEHENEESNFYKADFKDTHDQHTKSKRSSGQGIDEVPDHNRMARSSGQGINEDPEHDNEESNLYEADLKDTHEQRTKSKRSTGQGIDEVPDHNRMARSSGQGINEDPEHDNEESNLYEADLKDTHEQRTKSKRSSGQGIDEVPDHNRMVRSSGQGINEDPEHENEESNFYKADLKDTYDQHTKSKRSSGQGIDEVPDHNRMARSSGQGINEDPEHDNEESNFYKADLKDTHEQRTISKRSSGQGIDEEKVNPQDDSLFSETASNLDVSLEDEDEGGVEKDTQFPNGKDESNFDADTQILEEIDSEDVGEINGAMLADSKQSGMMMTDDSILATEEVISQNGNHGDGLSHRDDIQNPYAHHYERGFDDDDSNDQSQIGYILYNSIYSTNDDDKVIKLNKGVDFVLGLMNSMFTGEGQLTLDLPDINKKFGHGIMAGDFIGTQGYFRNPATLHRTGDVAITKIGDTVSLEVALGLGTLEAGFASYDLKILKIHQAGTIDVSVAKNSLKMKISLTYAPACNLTVDYVELDQLEGIKVNITGLGAFQSMFDMLSKWFLDNFTVSFKDIVNQKLADKARKAVAREDICKYFPQ